MDSYASELDRLIGYWLGAGETVDVILRDTLKRLTELTADPTSSPGNASSETTPRPSSESDDGSSRSETERNGAMDNC
jgi:hypothetical protein